MAVTSNNSLVHVVIGIVAPVALFVSWFGLSAYLLSKYASPLMKLL